MKPRDENHYVRMSEDAGNNHIISRVQPVCPNDACSLCANAAVRLRLVVGTSGAVKEVTALGANPRLAEAAIRAVKQWRYERYVLNGRPVKYETRTTILSWLCRT
jgi:protein TonB